MTFEITYEKRHQVTRYEIVTDSFSMGQRTADPEELVTVRRWVHGQPQFVVDSVQFRGGYFAEYSKTTDEFMRAKLTLVRAGETEPYDLFEVDGAGTLAVTIERHVWRSWKPQFKCHVPPVDRIMYVIGGPAMAAASDIERERADRDRR